ncbi:L-histidine N(alpha)-methyltransferase [uncultured Tateyamaria sp.]|uniref:L-histidine N(alpha)-methyltransferase n=1 Tax=Tateyamaria sp. 1078 TaxID=3417464 RepID=UPI00260E0E2A|nr:L-histidine N(alpha)-methyltransferase [uncultured Tateyamaria sp.]
MNKPIRKNAALIASAQAGLSQPQKTLDPKWFYDDVGSALFEQITALPEYYPTRTEVQILTDGVAGLARAVPEGAVLVELGSGASTKTRILLDHLPTLSGYMPLDISAAFLADIAAGLAAEYPTLDITPMAADFMAPLVFPETIAKMPKLAFFPGSTLGNLEAEAAIDLMARVRDWPQVAGFVIGVDLVKTPDRLIAAYDDAQGVTAAFNMNILHRLNREAAATFDPAQFRHVARWDADAERVEMHLMAREDIAFAVDGTVFHMTQGQSIHTENSHKYTRAKLDAMAAMSGWSVAQWFTDPNADFAVTLLVPNA